MKNMRESLKKGILMIIEKQVPSDRITEAILSRIEKYQHECMLKGKPEPNKIIVPFLFEFDKTKEGITLTCDMAMDSGEKGSEYIRKVMMRALYGIEPHRGGI